MHARVCTRTCTQRCVRCARMSTYVLHTHSLAQMHTWCTHTCTRCTHTHTHTQKSAGRIFVRSCKVWNRSIPDGELCSEAEGPGRDGRLPRSEPRKTPADPLRPAELLRPGGQRTAGKDHCAQGQQVQRDPGYRLWIARFYWFSRTSTKVLSLGELFFPPTPPKWAAFP